MNNREVTRLDLFVLIIECGHPVFTVGFADDEKEGAGMCHGAPPLPCWFAFWQAVGKGVKYAIDQIEFRRRMKEQKL